MPATELSYSDLEVNSACSAFPRGELWNFTGRKDLIHIKESIFNSLTKVLGEYTSQAICHLFSKGKAFYVACLPSWFFWWVEGEHSFLKAVGKTLIARYVLFNNSFINNVEVGVFYFYPSPPGKFQVAIATTEKATAKWVMVQFRSCSPQRAQPSGCPSSESKLCCVNVPSCALSQASVASAYGLDMV
jgi:hypothetical protein